MSFNDEVRKVIIDFRDKIHSGVSRKASTALKVSDSTFTRWVNGETLPRIENLTLMCDQLGIRLTSADKEPSKEVCFVNAKIVNTENNTEPPEAEDYLAVPVVDEVGAGPGIIPQNQLLSWFLVYRHQPAVRYRTNLLAVQIGKNSTSMLPTLRPLDIVLIDRDDKDVKKSGRMFLVMDSDGAGKIKRVAVEDIKNDCRIIYYSDNAADNPPEIYSLKEDFYGDWNRCIVGKVIWAWSDVSEK